MGIINKFISKYWNRAWESTFQQGLTQMRYGDYHSAIAAFDQAIRQQPTYEAYHNRATAYYRLKQYDEAINDYYQAIALDPGLAEAYLSLGIIYTKMEEYVQADLCYSELIRQHPDHTRAYTNRGYVRLKLEQIRDALSDFNRAIQLDATNGIAYYNRGAIYLEMGQSAKAQADWKQAKALGFLPAEESLKKQFPPRKK